MYYLNLYFSFISLWVVQGPCLGHFYENSKMSGLAPKFKKQKKSGSAKYITIHTS